MDDSAKQIALVTGGSGFIGSHVVDELLAQKFQVRCIVRNNFRWLANLPVEIVRAGFDDLRGIEKAVRGVDYIFHIAGTTKAKTGNAYWKGNVEPTRALLEATSKNERIRKFCFISSLAAVGPNPDGVPAAESSVCHPITAYGRSKREAELLCESFATRVSITIVRPPAVYGPRDRDVFELFRWVGYGMKPVIGKREKRFSSSFAPDLAKGIVETAISQKTSGETYFIADPIVHTLSEQVEMISELVHRKPIAIHFPAPLLYAVAGIVEGISFFGPRPAVLSVDKARDLLQEHWECSPEKIKRDLGFVCSTPLREGLAQTYAWYREQGWL
jgi:nucleoside-diphosphate-sugar epimerase